MSFNIVKNKYTKAEQTAQHLGQAAEAGLHFDGAAGYIDIVSPPDLGTKLSMEFILQADSISGGDQFFVDFGTGGRFIFGIESGTDKLSVLPSNAASWSSFGVLIIDDLKVHHLVMTLDGTAAILYDNGNQVGSATTTHSTDIDLCADARIGGQYTGVSKLFTGNIFRTRFWNKTLTAAEVTASYENATVPFADQYGVQTELIPSAGNRTFASGIGNWSAVAITPTNDGGMLKLDQALAYSSAANLDAFGNRSYISDSYFTNLVEGKKYRLTLDAKAETAGSKLYSTFQGGGTTTESITLTDSTAAYEFVFTAGSGLSGTQYLLLGLDTAEAFWIDNLTLNRVGAVADYDLAFANPTQSLMVQDRAGAADGTSSATGVSQVTPLVQVNATAARIGTSVATPADGDLDVSGNVSIGTGSMASVAAGPTLAMRGENPEITLRDTATGTPYAWISTNDHGDLVLAADHGNNASNSDINFRVDGTTHMTIASDGKVAIGSSDNGVGGTIDLSVGDPGTTTGGITLWSTDSSAHSIGFGDANSGTARYEGYVEYNHGTNSMILGTAHVARLTIHSDGEVVIGSTDQGVCMHGNTTGTASVRALNAARNTYKKLEFNALDYDFQTSSTPRLTISAAGLATFANGIAFTQTGTSATGAATTSSTLDHYEEGTWSAVISDGTNDATMAETTCNYTRIGRIVQISGYIKTSSLGSVSGGIRIKGLPFNAVTGNPGWSGIATGEQRNFSLGAAGYNVQVSTRFGTDYMPLEVCDTTYGSSAMQGSEWSADGAMTIGGTYLTS